MPPRGTGWRAPMADFATEVELKYAATPAALAALARAPRLGPADLGAVLVNDETDRYLDTADRRLAAVAWACRLRSGGDRSSWSRPTTA